MSNLELVEKVKRYNPNVDTRTLKKACNFAVKAHEGQKRHSGDPYYMHSFEVANILSELRLDIATIVTGLLHDTIEDTVATYQQINNIFGKEIANMVEGVTKLSKLELTSEKKSQAENFRKLLIAMSKDIRVIVVKLADRLHNMRTIQFIPDAARRKRIALETLEIYAPIAGRMGMQNFRDELEDLAFREINYDAYKSIVNRLEYLRDNSGNVVEVISQEIKQALQLKKIGSYVYGREKKPYSIWSKMQTKEISFEQLSDIIGFRVVVFTIEDCYKALGVIHSKWQSVPEKFKDYISTPKINNYRSIHSTVVGPKNHRVEMQIRTRGMHKVAEKGVAVHWLYKDLNKKSVNKRDHATYTWLRELVELLDSSENAEEFLDHTKKQMFMDQVFCFTPKGDLIKLPSNAIPIDFAYAVHTQIGDTCVGCRINGVQADLNTALKNGDEVEIISSEAQTPSINWGRFVITGKARSAIRRFFRSKKKEENEFLGQRIIEKALKNRGYNFSEKSMEIVLGIFNIENVGELYEKVALGEVRVDRILEILSPGEKQKNLYSGKSNPLKIIGLPDNLSVQLAQCCFPLPGDVIVAITDKIKGTLVHKINCSELTFERNTKNWRDVYWKGEPAKDQYHLGRINVIIAHEPGSLGVLANIIGKKAGNIANLLITERSKLFYEMIFDIQVRDLSHLMEIISAIKPIPNVNYVGRDQHGNLFN